MTVMAAPRQSTTTCTCTREITDGYLCHDCTAEVLTDLRTIATLARGLNEKRARYSAIVYSHGRSRSADPALPYDPRVTRVANPIRDHLRAVCAYVFDHRPAVDVPVYVTRDSIGAMSLWLTSHMRWLRGDPAGPGYAARIRTDRERIERLFDRPPEQLYLGVCNAPTSDGTCPESLYADASTVIRAGRADLQADSAHAHCTCGATHEVEPRRVQILHDLTVYQATMPELVSLRPLIGMDGTSHAMLARYAQRGLLPNVGQRLERNARGEWRRVNTYRIGDVNRAVTAWKEREK